MKRISKNWIIEPHLDYEYKKYSLLAYLQETERAFSTFNIFPYLDDLRHCRDSITRIISQRDHVLRSFPKKIEGIETNPPGIKYSSKIKDDGTLREVVQIAKFSLSRINEAVAEGDSLAGKVQKKINFFPIGVHSSWDDEGFLLVRRKPYILTFKYIVQRVSEIGESYPVRFEWLRRFRDTSIQKLDRIKLELVRSESGMAPKAAFAVTGGDHLPLKGAILPLSSQQVSDWVTQKKEG